MIKKKRKWLSKGEFTKKYNAYLSTTKWKKLRDIVLARDGYKCIECQNTENLIIHHLNYDTIFSETMDCLVVLCRFCHEKIHKKKPRRKIMAKKKAKKPAPKKKC